MSNLSFFFRFAVQLHSLKWGRAVHRHPEKTSTASIFVATFPATNLLSSKVFIEVYLTPCLLRLDQTKAAEASIPITMGTLLQK